MSTNNTQEIKEPIVNNETKKIKKKKKSNRCSFDGCKKKLKLSDMKCRCGNTYCNKHRMMEQHSCSYLKNTTSKDIYLTKTQHLGLGGGNFKQLEAI